MESKERGWKLKRMWKEREKEKWDFEKLKVRGEGKIEWIDSKRKRVGER